MGLIDKERCINIEKELDKTFIPISFSKTNKPLDLAEALYKFFIKTHATYQVKNGEISNEQCSTRRARSIEDLYLLCKNYYNYISVRKLTEVVNGLVDIKILSTHFCHVVKRQVHVAQNVNTTTGNIASYLDSIDFNPKCKKDE